jgi:Fe-S cluster assembly scaffold protein SufB
MTKEQQIDLTLLLATFRAFNEQLYNLKGTHSQVVKLKFNRLLKVSRQYEKEIIKWMDGSDELEAVYDALMDVLIEVKSNIDGQK